MTFDAFLVHANGTIVDKTLYVYEWKDDAFVCDTNRTVNYTESQLQKVYYSNHFIYAPGNYQMNVTVYKKATFGNKRRGSKVASGTMEFQLTGNVSYFELRTHHI